MSPLESDSVRYRRSTQVHEEALERELALLHLERAEIRSLNEVAAVLWEALGDAEFGTVNALTSLLAEAHPETPTETHHAHVVAFLDSLEAAGFVERVDGSSGGAASE